MKGHCPIYLLLHGKLTHNLNELKFHSMKSHDFVSDFFSSTASQLRSRGDFQMVAKLGWWPQDGFACMSPVLSSCIALSWSPFPFHVAT